MALGCSRQQILIIDTCNTLSVMQYALNDYLNFITLNFITLNFITLKSTILYLKNCKHFERLGIIPILVS